MSTVSSWEEHSKNVEPTAGHHTAGSRPATARCMWDGFELLVLRNSSLELAVAPALGAKIVSLKNLHTGPEWLWRPTSRLKLFRNQPGDDFSRSTLVGWDECLPTIAPCTWKNRAFPDQKNNMGWSGWEEFRNLTPNDKTNLQEQEQNEALGQASVARRRARNRNAGRDSSGG